MTARTVLALALAIVAIQNLSSFALFLFGMISGPFATLIVGLLLLFIAKMVYFNAEPSATIRG